MSAVTYSLRPEVALLPFDSGEDRLRFQVIARNRRIAVSSCVAALFDFLRVPRTECELQSFASENFPTNTNVPVLLQQAPLKYFVWSSEEGSAPGIPSPARSYLLVKQQLFNADVANSIAGRFEWLLQTRLMVVLLILTVVVHVLFALSSAYRHPFTLSFTTTQWVWAWIGVYLAVLFHEIGHCAACTRFGAKGGAIGIGLYIIWPVLYADTTDAWRLQRGQRVVVDIAGMYFQLLLSTVCILVGSWIASPVLVVIAKSTILATAINLNPFLRFDAYWLLTDGLGIPNIRDAVTEFWRDLYTCFRRPTRNASRPRLLHLSPRRRLMFGVYCIAGSLFFANVTFRCIYILPHLLSTLPIRVFQVWSSLQVHPLSLLAIKKLLVFVLFSAGLFRSGVFVGRRLRQLIKRVAVVYKDLTSRGIVSG